MKKLAPLMMLAAGGFVFAGCAVDTADEPIDESIEAACANQDGTNAAIALLANAMASELGRWELLADFESFRGFNNQLMLRLKANAPCTNGCVTIKALLAFQDSRLDQKFVFSDGQKLNSWSF